MRNASVASVTVKINDSPCWKDLMKVKSLYLAGKKGVVGSGDIIRFWEDSGWGEAPLYQTYPKLFLFCNSKDTSIAVFKHDIHAVSFSRWLHGPLASQWDELATMVQNLVLTDTPDTFLWKWDAKKVFTVSSLYNHLCRNVAGPNFSFI